jgi:hypothetical protein
MAMFLSYNVISYNYKPVDLIISKLDIMCYGQKPLQQTEKLPGKRRSFHLS